MSRFYVKPEDAKGEKIFVSGQEAHHALNVMRLKVGDKITAFDGTGREYIGLIEETGKATLTIKIDKVIKPKKGKAYCITLAQAVPRMDKMDYIIQKATELGADSVIPIRTHRTVTRFTKDRISAKIKRWERIALESSKQCGRSQVTKIGEYADFKDLLSRIEAYDLVIMPCLAGVDKKGLKKELNGFSVGSMLIIIGPEGGFDSDEIKIAAAMGVSFISLGENTRKCDSA
ncbi:MAG: 16S rRNA (uracil(1498)-N(3))-methyltransferase, partial [Candidatus Omnitrophica bacterium]|nr:16S rRNA (uracil(1498)-N(3))-methyltransferase [Candidatus Omnitrophota bacterium]